MKLKMEYSWILVIVFLGKLEVSSGFRCYQCRQTSALPANALYDSVANSLGTDLCPDWLYTGPRDHDVYCDPTVYNACVKMVMTDNHTEQNYFIYRDCYNSTANTCSELTDHTLTHSVFGDITGRIYCCFGNHCNTASTRKLGVITSLVLVVWRVLLGD